MHTRSNTTNGHIWKYVIYFSLDTQKQNISSPVGWGMNEAYSIIIQHCQRAVSGPQSVSPWSPAEPENKSALHICI